MDLESDKALTCQSLREPLLSEEFQTSNDNSCAQTKLRRVKTALLSSAATIIVLAALSVIFYLQTSPRCQGLQTPSSVLVPECQYALNCQFSVTPRSRDSSSTIEVSYSKDVTPSQSLIASSHSSKMLGTLAMKALPPPWPTRGQISSQVRNNYPPQDHISILRRNPSLRSLEGRGSVKIDNPQRYGLKPGVAIPNITNTELFKLSVFHQLHCLVRLTISSSASSHSSHIIQSNPTPKPL